MELIAVSPPRNHPGPLWTSYQKGHYGLEGERGQRILSGDGQELAKLSEGGELLALVVRLTQAGNDALCWSRKDVSRGKLYRKWGRRVPVGPCGLTFTCPLPMPSTPGIMSSTPSFLSRPCRALHTAFAYVSTSACCHAWAGGCGSNPTCWLLHSPCHLGPARMQRRGSSCNAQAISRIAATDLSPPLELREAEAQGRMEGLWVLLAQLVLLGLKR